MTQDEAMWRLHGNTQGWFPVAAATWPLRLPLVRHVRAGLLAARNWAWSAEQCWLLAGIARGWI